MKKTTASKFALEE